MAPMSNVGSAGAANCMPRNASPICSGVGTRALRDHDVAGTQIFLKRAAKPTESDDAFHVELVDEFVHIDAEERRHSHAAALH